MILFIAFVVGVLLTAVCLWAGMKITRVEGNFLGMLAIAFIAMLLGLIPFVGWILALAAMLFLICKWTSASFWPDAVLMVVVARIVGALAWFAIAMLAAKTLSD